MHEISPLSIRQGGKEELRVSVLKTYLLRLRTEQGARAVRQLLAKAGIDPLAIDNETEWVSAAAARRAMHAIREALGHDALRARGEWSTHAESLGAQVGLLRGAESPIDAYRYVASHDKETTRIGTWELEEIPTQSRNVEAVRMIYRLRDGEDGAEPLDAAGEALLCDARHGELASYPRLWGLREAVVTHESCLAKGGETCTYRVTWHLPRSKRPIVLSTLATGLVLGLVMGVAGGPISGAIALVLGGGLGGLVGHLREKAKVQASARVFEKHRTLALERALEIKGGTSSGVAPGDLTGTMLGGKFRIGRKIGSGGIGVVYAATHAALGHEVAIKVLRGAAARDGSEIARLRREAHIQALVEHPNVARVMDLDQMPDGSIYVVMERLHGRSLADKLARETLVAPGFAIPMFLGVLRALGAAHKQGVVHRDLKPGNIFLCDDGTAKVLDFGMGKLQAAESLTQAGYTLGTPEYMAPEQCIGATVEPRTDLYALGVLMYEALTGELPIQSRNRRELLDLHQRQIPVPMKRKRPDLPIPDVLDQAVMQCLRKRTADRPKSAGELEELIASIPLDGLLINYPPGTGRRPLPSQAPPRNDPSARTLPGVPASNPEPDK